MKDNMTHDATRRPRSQYAAGPIQLPVHVVDDPQLPLFPELDANPSIEHDPINQPKHYTQHPSGIECIQITEHMGFNLGNAVKYIWRADLKNNAIEDLQKARWYIDRELAKRGVK